MDITIIIPVKDEVENINDFAKEINEVMNEKFYSWECIWVDDGSVDGSFDEK